MREPPSPAGHAQPPGRVALVHDWLTGMRGGERVLESLCRIFPDADLLTLVHSRGSVSPELEARRIRTSFVQRLPRPTRAYRHYLPLFPAAIEGFDLDDVDLVVSTSHCAAKAVVPTGRALHLCYCHSPMRYAWDQFPHYFGPARVGAATSRVAASVMAALARWDRDSAHRVHRFLANSSYVAGRIAEYYNRPASVVYPPVNTEFFTPGDVSLESYFLVVSALVPYKRIEIAIEAANRLKLPLKIVGSGPDRGRLEALAGPTVEFLGSLDGLQLREAYRRAQALVLPGEEDFGIAPVESMACGRPVVALARGGALETVVPGQTGLLVQEPTAEAFAEALDAVPRAGFSADIACAHAARFSTEQFEHAFRAIVAEALEAPAPC